jgi:beta-xylosidase
MMARRRLASIVLVAGVLASGCGGASGNSRPDPGGVMMSHQSSAQAAPSATEFRNPVYDSDFPDPGVILVGKTYYAFGTNSGNTNVQVLTSPDLVHWTPKPDALPQLGSWAVGGNTWAPEVIEIDGRFHLYYVARSGAHNVQCIGHATSDKPGGPYTDDSTAPLVCQAPIGGSIDPNPFRDHDGKLYLIWKNDGNCCGSAVYLWAQQLSDDGSALIGSPRKLLTNTKAWQGDLVEAPEMVVHDDRYYLFYSANAYSDERYAMGYAECTSPLGPCTDRSDQPLVSSTDVATGPGHCFVIETPAGEWWLLFHAWSPGSVGSVQPGRQLWLERLHWDGDTPRVDTPSAAPQPVPRAWS